MGHKCFISYKNEDKDLKNELVALFDRRDIIDKSLDYVIDSENANYIMQVIREQYLQDSTVTLCLIGQHSSENEGIDSKGFHHNYYIMRELQASLYNGKGNTRNGILGVVIPKMYDAIFKGTYTCSICGKEHNHVSINDSTVIKEFSENYYIQPHDGCAWDDDRYCILVKWDDFIKNPEDYIDKAFSKRSEPIADKVRVRVR